MTQERLCHFVNRWRKHNKISQAQLSEMSGLPKSTISVVECEYRRIPKESMVKLADAMGVSSTKLLKMPVHRKGAPNERRAKRKKSSKRAQNGSGAIIENALQLTLNMQENTLVRAYRKLPASRREQVLFELMKEVI